MATEQSFPLTRHLVREDAIVQGADWSRQFRLRFVKEDGTWEVWDTGVYTGAIATIRNSYDDPVLVEATTANGMIELGIVADGDPALDPYAYNINLALPRSVTGGSALAQLQLGVWDLWLIDTYDHHIPVYHGRCALERMPTR
jgi:hypothetical protein